MPAKSVDGLAEHPRQCGCRRDRRLRARTDIHWPVLLLPDHGLNPIDTVTQNLSSGGFYCFSMVPLLPGEVLYCSLKVPAHDPNAEERTLALECRVRVMRSEATPDGLFGIACRIEDYHLAVSGMVSDPG
jgi:hypothetical protein